MLQTKPSIGVNQRKMERLVLVKAFVVHLSLSTNSSPDQSIEDRPIQYERHSSHFVAIFFFRINQHYT
jgi:hypothetical protein